MDEPAFPAKQFVRECNRLGIDINPNDSVHTVAHAIQLGSVANFDGLLRARCLVPGSRNAILSRQDEEALWQVFFMAAPEQRCEFEPRSKRRKTKTVS